MLFFRAVALLEDNLYVYDSVMLRQVAITAMSTSMLAKKTGMVTLVGIAARLVTSAAAMELMANAQRIILLPASATNNTVMGDSTHP